MSSAATKTSLRVRKVPQPDWLRRHSRRTIGITVGLATLPLLGPGATVAAAGVGAYAGASPAHWLRPTTRTNLKRRRPAKHFGKASGPANRECSSQSRRPHPRNRTLQSAFCAHTAPLTSNAPRHYRCMDRLRPVDATAVGGGLISTIGRRLCNMPANDDAQTPLAPLDRARWLMLSISST